MTDLTLRQEQQKALILLSYDIGFKEGYNKAIENLNDLKTIINKNINLTTRQKRNLCREINNKQRNVVVQEVKKT